MRAILSEDIGGGGQITAGIQELQGSAKAGAGVASHSSATASSAPPGQSQGAVAGANSKTDAVYVLVEELGLAVGLRV